MRAALALAIAVAGCTTMEEDSGTWEPVETITGPLAPEVGPVPVQPAAQPTLRVATWNLHYAEDPATLAANLLASTEISRADVIMVQEVEAHPGEPATRARQFAEALGMTWVYAPARIEGDGTHGIALVSRFPLENVAIRKLPFIDTTYTPRRRNALTAEVVVGTTRVRIVNVHLDVRIGPIDRIRQLRPAVLDLPDPAIVGGDFNSNPWAWIENTVPLTGTEAVVGMSQSAVLDDYMFEQSFAGAIPDGTATMRIPLYDIRIDNLYSRGAAITASGVEHVDGSDHWPVWFDVAVE